MLKIHHYPDPVLLKPAEPIIEINDEIKKLSIDMIETMHSSRGVGLAGPQVGVSKQIIVVCPTGEKGTEMTYINPKITKKKGRICGEEGCLSFPGIYGNVNRAVWVEIEATLLNGQKIIFTEQDFAARVLQHEIDHVNGVIFVNKFQPAEKVVVRNTLRKMEEEFVAV